MIVLWIMFNRNISIFIDTPISLMNINETGIMMADGSRPYGYPLLTAKLGMQIVSKMHDSVRC